jgi:hypothetical protein
MDVRPKILPARVTVVYPGPAFLELSPRCRNVKLVVGKFLFGFRVSPVSATGNAARTVLCGGRSAMVVPTATVDS